MTCKKERDLQIAYKKAIVQNPPPDPPTTTNFLSVQTPDHPLPRRWTPSPPGEKDVKFFDSEPIRPEDFDIMQKRPPTPHKDSTQYRLDLLDMIEDKKKRKALERAVDNAMSEKDQKTLQSKDALLDLEQRIRKDMRE